MEQHAPAIQVIALDRKFISLAVLFEIPPPTMAAAAD
jgi:hypothetical protein